MSTGVHICQICESVINERVFHTCLKGITENINRLHSNLNLLLKNKNDHLEGLKYALGIVERVEDYHRALGKVYEYPNPFIDIQNDIRMRLGMPLLTRYSNE